MVVISTLRRLRKKYHYVLKASLSYRVRSRHAKAVE